MSMDMVDNLEHAEDYIDSARRIIGSALDHLVMSNAMAAEVVLVEGLETLNTYSRMTCDCEGSITGDECDDEYCGCPCHISDEYEPPERELPQEEP